VLGVRYINLQLLISYRAEPCSHASSPQRHELETVNPAARARSQLPHIPLIPSSHDQPSPLYRVPV